MASSFLFNPKQRGHKDISLFQMERKLQTWQSCGAIPAKLGIAEEVVRKGGAQIKQICSTLHEGWVLSQKKKEWVGGKGLS